METTIIIIAVIAGVVIVAAVLLSSRSKKKTIVVEPGRTSPSGNSQNAQTRNSNVPTANSSSRKYTQNDRKLLELIDDLAEMYKKTGR